MAINYDPDPVLAAAALSAPIGGGTIGNPWALPMGATYVTLSVEGGGGGGSSSKSADAEDVLHRALHIKSIDTVKRTADFVASTDDVDSHEEIVDQNSWQLGDFLKNPVILFAHDSRSLPIGQAVEVAVRGGQLECRIQFATADMNPLAEQVWKMVQGRYLRAVSVGFIPKSYRVEMRDGAEILVWSDCLLKEVSVVPIGSNPSALAKMKSKAVAQAAKPSTGAPASDPTIERAEEGASENNEMDIKELQAKYDALVAEKALAEKSASDLGIKTSTLETELASTKSATAALSKELEKASADRDAAIKRADDAEATIAKASAEAQDKAIADEVDALIGKKIAATEKDDFVALRKANPDLFASMIAKRADMKLTERVTSPDTKGASDGSLNGDPGAGYLQKL